MNPALSSSQNLALEVQGRNLDFAASYESKPAPIKFIVGFLLRPGQHWLIYFSSTERLSMRKAKIFTAILFLSYIAANPASAEASSRLKHKNASKHTSSSKHASSKHHYAKHHRANKSQGPTVEQVP